MIIYATYAGGPLEWVTTSLNTLILLISNCTTISVITKTYKTIRITEAVGYYSISTIRITLAIASRLIAISIFFWSTNLFIHPARAIFRKIRNARIITFLIRFLANLIQTAKCCKTIITKAKGSLFTTFLNTLRGS